MKDTPIFLNGPFTLHHHSDQHVIRGRDGAPLVDLTSQLIDGSGNKKKYPDGIIRSRVARTEEAQFVLQAMNELYERDHW